MHYTGARNDPRVVDMSSRGATRLLGMQDEPFPSEIVSQGRKSEYDVRPSEGVNTNKLTQKLSRLS